MRRWIGTGLASLSLVGNSVAVDAVEETPPFEETASAIDCSVSGYDVLISNRGVAPLDAGTTLKWTVPFARMSGTHRLVATLEPDRRLFLSGVLGSSFLDPGKPCSVEFEEDD